MQFVPIRLNTLRPDSELGFDLYIEVANKPIHYRRSRDRLESVEINNIKIKNIKKLFIPAKQEDDYLNYLEAGLEDAVLSKAPVARRGELVNDSVTTLADNIERHIETESGFKRTSTQVTKVVEFLQSDKGALNAILSAAGTSLDDAQHAATVSSLSLGAAMKLGYGDTKVLFDIALAGLLHDLGKSKLEIDLTRPYGSMDPKSHSEYQRHPEISVQLLSGKNYIGGRVLELVLNHEELNQGKGYPKKKNLMELPYYCQILSLCNGFDAYCRYRGLLHLDAIESFLEINNANYDVMMLNSLVSLLK